MEKIFNEILKIYNKYHLTFEEINYINKKVNDKLLTDLRIQEEFLIYEIWKNNDEKAAMSVDGKLKEGII